MGNINTERKMPFYIRTGRRKKKRCDAMDIQFLLSWCARNHAYPTSEEVPNASKQFVSWFIQGYGGKDYWTNARYDLENGLFLLSLVQSPTC
jgi:hypothetical protein